MQPITLAIVLAMICGCIGLIVLVRLRHADKRREWSEALACAAEPETIAPLRWEALPSPRAIESAPLAIASLPRRITVRLHVPSMRDSDLATDRQLDLLGEWLGEEAKALRLSKRQASLLLDICHYVNGIWMTMTGELPGAGIRMVMTSAILEDESLWRSIRAWGRGRYSSGRSSHVPDLNPKSPLFRRVSSLAEDMMNDPEGWLTRQGPRA